MRTDSQIQLDVLSELKWEPSVNATEIGVEVKEGVVTLAGHVSSYGEKWHAEKAALRVMGVKALAVEMDVVLPGPSQRSDGDIARSVESVLKWTCSFPSDALKVMVEHGWITLTGEVDWDYQRQGATAAVRHLWGVKGVSDQITLKPKITISAVKSDIEDALNRRARSDARNIAVQIDGSNVTLTGTVHSWSERELARHTAWGTPGVKNVVDHLSVTY